MMPGVGEPRGDASGKLLAGALFHDQVMVGRSFIP